MNAIARYYLVITRWSNLLGTQHLQASYDLAILGGGIHATSLAAEAASRGLSVLVLQANDFAAGASGGPNRLVSGEIQRLENFNFFDISAALKDLNTIHQKAPRLVYPTPVYLLDNPDIRSSARIKTGIGLYKKLFPANVIAPTQHRFGNSDGFSYSEFIVNRNRLILAYAQFAKQKNADLINYCRLVDSERNSNSWYLKIKCSLEPKVTLKTRAKILINSTGWQVNELLSSIIRASSRCRTTHVFSGRLIIKRPDYIEQALSLQQDDRSLTYVIPIDDKHLSIEPIIAERDSDKARKKALEKFKKTWNRYFKKIQQEDILLECWTRQAMPEDYASARDGAYADSLLDLNNPGQLAVLLNVFGLCPAKHRKLAEQALDILQPFTDAPRNSDYSSALLPSGEIPEQGLMNRLASQHPQLEKQTLERLVDNYGSAAEHILSNAPLGQHFGSGLYRAEVDYLIDNEWVYLADDILWRRTQLGLSFEESKLPDLQSYIQQRVANNPPSSTTHVI